MLASMVVPISAAKVGEVVDYALHTDIVAQIDGHPLRSYNVGGRTAVIAEDLARYGFKVTWDGVKRELMLERTTNDRGEVVNPTVYPKYEEETLRAPVGSRAEAILSTDIKTFVAGKQVEGFNADGETLIWFSDLDSYGDVVWDAEKRVANLVLGDPMENSLQKLIQPLLDWKATAGTNSYYELYPGTKGTLFVGYWSGTPHGTACKMEYVDLAGNRTDINSILPTWGFGSEYYVRPRNVIVHGDQLIFTTIFQETADSADAETGVSRDYILTVDLKEGKLTDTCPVSPNQKLTMWSANFKPEEGAQTNPEEALEITFGKQTGTDEVVVLDASIPYPGIELQVTQSKAFLIVGSRTDPSYNDTSFGRAYYALARSDLPSMFREEVPFRPHNTDEQRRFVNQSFKVTVNGKTIPGNLSWVGKNGRRCLRYDFDQSLALSDGDMVTVKMGLGL